jgi:hypothetical protein
MKWNLTNLNGQVAGILWFTDGTGLGSVIGTANRSAGTFNVTIEPVLGNSPPEGTITGTVADDGTIHATVSLARRCEDAHVQFKRGARTATPE